MWNCKHTIFPIILGVSVQALDGDTLKKYRSLSTEQVTIDGKTMSRYEWSQEQRRVETAVRMQKDVATLAKASGDMKAVRAWLYAAADMPINSLQIIRGIMAESHSDTSVGLASLLGRYWREKVSSAIRNQDG